MFLVLTFLFLELVMNICIKTTNPFILDVTYNLNQWHQVWTINNKIFNLIQCNPLSLVCYPLWCAHLRVSWKFLFNGMTCSVFIVHIHASFLLCKEMKQFGIWWKGGCELFSLNTMCSWQWLFSNFPPIYFISQKWQTFLGKNTFNTEKHVFPSIFSKKKFSKILQTLDG